jgi:hypothetical protein
LPIVKSILFRIERREAFKQLEVVMERKAGIPRAVPE